MYTNICVCAAIITQKRVCVCSRSTSGGWRHNVCPQYQFGFGSSHGTYRKNKLVLSVHTNIVHTKQSTCILTYLI